MNLATQKTLSLMLLIGFGVLLKHKGLRKEQLAGIKVIILSIALPSTIFVALLHIQVDVSLLVLPLVMLTFNLVMLVTAYHLLPLIGINRKSSTFRTYWLLIPSLSPGLSCFPFMVEFLGEESLGKAALADVGNKLFVLIILYLLAMHLFYQVRGQQAGKIAHDSQRRQLQELIVSLAREPINLVMAAALIMRGYNLDLDLLPPFLRHTIVHLSMLMTPLILIFIGLQLGLDRHRLSQIFTVLLCRSGMAFCLSALLIGLTSMTMPASLVLAVVLPQSAASFWPYAHMSAVAALEKNQESTFDSPLALNILGLSLPFSTLVILTVCSVGELFTQPQFLLPLGATLIAAGVAPVLIRFTSGQRHKAAMEQRCVSKT